MNQECNEANYVEPGVYITQANMKGIVSRMTEIKNLNLGGDIYKRQIYFFSKYEKNELLAIQELLKNPENYFDHIYVPYERPADTFSKVYEGTGRPAYHQDKNCERLHSDYENFEIPKSIRERGKGAVIEFRNWFETVKHYLPDRADIFVMRLKMRWGIETSPKSIVYDNSGYLEREDITIEELQVKIARLIKDAGRFYYDNEQNNQILHRFSKCTFLAYTKDPIEGNNTDYTDEEVRELLAYYDEKFKRPLKHYLIEYYRLELNEDIEMSGKILDRLGFTPCRQCYNNDAQTHLGGLIS